jgi:8-oxo-dGTP pyrophosphatase MutT (NUDIX family)
MKNNHKHIFRQSGVLPYKIEKGTVYFLLITTTSQKEWIIPKGRLEKGMSPAESALKEAEEEAGIQGTISGEAIGSYSFQKKKTGQTWVVDVFPMKVGKEMKRWPEKGRRKRIWCSIEEAVQRITNDELKELIVNFQF